MHRFLAAAIGILIAYGALGQTDPLTSWNDGAVKRRIVAFVDAVTRPGAPDYLPPAQRIATRTVITGGLTRAAAR